MENKIQELYKEYRSAFSKIRNQYRIARWAQFIIFGSAVLFWIPTIFPSVMLMLPLEWQFIPQEKWGQLYQGNMILWIFIGVSLLIYLFSWIYAKVMPALRAKEDALADELINDLFPDLQISKNLEIKPQQLQSSQLFAWFNPYLYAGMYDQSYGVVSPLTTFGTLKKYMDDSIFYIADIGLVEDNVAKKSSNIMLKIPVVNWVYMIYEFGIKRALSGKLSDQIDYTFRGLYSWAKFNKKLEGLTVVLPDNLEKNIGFLAKTIQSLNFKRDQVSYMEDPEFEKEFVVYTTNDIEARYILSAAMMERMTQLKRKFDKPMMFSFVDNRIHIAIASPTGLFSWDMESLKSEKAIEELYHDVSTCIGIINDLKLERRIWG